MQGFLGIPDLDRPAPGSTAVVPLWVDALQRFVPRALTGLAISGFTVNQIPVGTSFGGLAGTTALTFNGTTLALTGALTVSTTLNVTGTSTLAAINASGDIACTNNQITLVRSTAGGTVFSARNDDTTSTTSVEFRVVGTTTGGAGRNAIRLVHQANLGAGDASYLLQTGKVSAILFEDTATIFNQREGGPYIFGINDTEVARFTTTQHTIAYTTASTTSATGALVVTGGVGIGGALNVASNAGIGGALSSLAVLQLGATNPLSGTTQIGHFVNMTGTSAGTVALRGSQFSLATAAAAYTCTEATGFLCGSVAKGAGSTITRATSAWMDAQGNGTNNCGLLISSSLTYTGNWALRSESTAASLFAGTLAVTDTTDASAIGTASVVLSGGLSVAKAIFLGGLLNIADAKHITVGTSTGTKIGTATTQKIGLWNVTPVVQPATTGTLTGFTIQAGTAVNHQSTFTGNTGSAAYTIGDIVLALKQVGVLAA